MDIQEARRLYDVPAEEKPDLANCAKVFHDKIINITKRLSKANRRRAIVLKKELEKYQIGLELLTASSVDDGKNGDDQWEDLNIDEGATTSSTNGVASKGATDEDEVDGSNDAKNNDCDEEEDNVDDNDDEDDYDEDDSEGYDDDDYDDYDDGDDYEDYDDSDEEYDSDNEFFFGHGGPFYRYREEEYYDSEEEDSEYDPYDEDEEEVEYLRRLLLGRGMQAHKPRQSPSDVILNKSVDLETFYSGAVLKMIYNKTKLCTACAGSGGSGKTETICPRCVMGNGGIGCEHERGHPYVTQYKFPCGKCKTEGKFHAETETEITIRQGSGEGILVLNNEGHQLTMLTPPGSLKVHIKQQPHKIFQRNQSDLQAEITLELREALCGFSHVMKHLSGKHLRISGQQGEVVTPGLVRKLRGKGMPKMNSNMFGDLFITFHVNVDLPRNFITVVKSKEMAKAFGLTSVKTPQCDPDDIEDVELSERVRSDPEFGELHGPRHYSATDEDDFYHHEHRHGHHHGHHHHGHHHTNNPFDVHDGCVPM